MTSTGTNVSVITSFAGGQQIDLFGDVAMVKAAVLYADEVEVLSLSSLALAEWKAFTPAEAEYLKSALSGNTTDANDIPTFTPQSARISADTGIRELMPAMARGVLSVDQSVPPTGDVFQAFIDKAVSRIFDPARIVLLDPRLSVIVRQASVQTRQEPPKRAQSNAREVVVGAGLIARLPTFTKAPMDELLDLRDDIETPLVRYRSAVARLQGDIVDDPYIAAREADVDALWRERVQGELLDIDDALRSHGLVHELAKNARISVASLLAGSAGAIGVGYSNLGDVASLTAGAVAAAAGVTAVIPKAIVEAKAGRDEVARRDFYYLYRLGMVGQRST